MGLFSDWSYIDSERLRLLQQHGAEGVQQLKLLRQENGAAQLRLYQELQAVRAELAPLANLQEIANLLREQTTVLSYHTELLEAVVEIQMALLHISRPPGRLGIVLTQEIRVRSTDMAQMDVIGAKLSFPPLPALNDVVTREVTIEGAGVVENGVFTPQTITQGYPKDASLTDEIFGPEGQAIRATLVDIDNAGNRSPVGDVLEATLADTFAPAKPGSLGIVFTGEVTVEVPEPTTEAPSEEPTTEAPSEEPTTEAPSEEPTTEAPSEEPTTEAPSEEPTTEAPSEEPSTEAPSEEPPVV